MASFNVVPLYLNNSAVKLLFPSAFFCFSILTVLVIFFSVDFFLLSERFMGRSNHRWLFSTPDSFLTKISCI